jgi:glycosyltransferase involved in cell wall biosynthesis
MRPEISVVLSTYNRGPLLESAVRSVLAQQQPVTPAFELLVVDNNSTDDTRGIIERIAAQDSRLKYVFEARQGLSYARNAGIAQARGRFVAFTDDDVRAEGDWLAAIVRAFEEHPAADVVGGRVLPIWPSAPPAWLTRDHWAPLALVDHGEHPIAITSGHSIGVVGANMAFRRSVFDAVGLFATEFQRVKDRIGSVEDHDFLLRVYRSGRQGVYDPRIVVHAAVQPNRLEPAYHRRWHRGHGHFHALLRSEQMEATNRGRLLGVPAPLYRQALEDLIRWARATVARDRANAFLYEMRLRFFYGFFRTRRRECRAQTGDTRRERLERLLQAGSHR